MARFPRYVIDRPAHLDGVLYKEGATVEWNGPPGPHMQPAVDAQGREDAEARRRKDSVKPGPLPTPDHPDYVRMLAQQMATDPNDPVTKLGAVLAQLLASSGESKAGGPSPSE